MAVCDGEEMILFFFVFKNIRLFIFGYMNTKNIRYSQK